MISTKTLTIFILSSILLSCTSKVQHKKKPSVAKEIRLVAKTSAFSGFVDSQVTISLELEGLDINLGEQEDSSSDKFWGIHNNRRFGTSITVTPDKVGLNTYGPYSITLLGKEYVSNKVEINTVKRESESISILSPSSAKLNDLIFIEVFYSFSSKQKLTLKENDFFDIRSTSSSSSINNGERLNSLGYAVKVIKEGTCVIDKNSFWRLPSYATVEPVEIIITD
ncbi:hypothetical protein [Saccharicrinis aurantiacus]|uniref:hypothetical protein n=1 Tax=Saccharicrinis aurantiacus TaxID=1849719 RepID=UPI002492E7B6|nr:hypothetical protein [Saccharicrinis aurantiacus]